MPLVKTSCPCGQKKTKVYAWGNYHAVRWYTVDHFCEKCFASNVLSRLKSHASDCGCTFEMCARSGYTLPDFIRNADLSCETKAA